MRDPYEVLEINKGAGKEEIQKAYRRLVKKYHPDQYRNHPLEKLAEEKMAEINAAYDYLMKNGAGDYYKGSGQSRGGGREYDDSFFQRIRMLISNGDYHTAEQLLDQSSTRTAEWYYLKGIIYQRKGWYGQALSHLQTAVNMEPGNAEYRSTLNAMNYDNRVYKERSSQYGGRDVDDLCTICQCLICTDCCCECMGSDFITCC
ncbi:MAG: DnaJ domain-containing protein [Caldicoprobacterales bacterium]|nr:DnaJ domain-containing protein [Clostridiales bacterium]